MAAILDILLQKRVDSAVFVDWLTKRMLLDETPECLQPLSQHRQEFVPFFLNYLRDQSTPLLQSGAPPAPSPATTPVQSSKTKKLLTPHGDGSTSVQKRHSGNRVQLFAPSPVERDDVLASPNTSLDSPASDFKRTNPKTQFTPEHRNKKQTLGDFLMTPDSTKKKSPHWNKNKDSPSFSPTKRRSGGRKSLESARRVVLQSASPLPKYSLGNMADFPPMDCKESTPKSRDSTPGGSLESRECTPPEDQSSRRNKPSRRITPTSLRHRARQSPLAGMMHVSPLSECAESKVPDHVHPAFRDVEQASSMDEERELIRQDLIRRRRESSTSQSTPTPDAAPCLAPPTAQSVTTPTKPVPLARSSLASDRVVACMDEVTKTEDLDVLVETYSALFDEWLISNVTVELYFLLQLLAVRGPMDEELLKDRDSDDVIYLDTVHNMVYFAVQVLERQRSLVSCLERGLVRLLSDNPRVAHFSPSLARHLAAVYGTSVVRQVSAGGAQNESFSSVSYQIEEDHRGNFPDDRSFHMFKKQRDVFYELLREWERKHHESDWSVHAVLGDRVRQLVSCGGLLTYIRFTDLFIAQLLKMCKGDDSSKSGADEAEIGLLAELKLTNPDKFKKLRERFTAPSSYGGPCPPPSFPGCQAFFQAFILLAGNPIFHQHLTDGLARRINTLDDSTIHASPHTSDSTDHVTTCAGSSRDHVLDAETRDHVVSTLLSLRLLGKFLGLVVYMPYQTATPLPEPVLNILVQTRNTNKLYPVDVLTRLRRAVHSGRTLLTVPWLVDYLSMCDPAAFQLEYVKQVVDLLVTLYRRSSAEFREGRRRLNMLLITALLGWLFETPSFPEGVFFLHEDLPPDPDPSQQSQTAFCIDECEEFVDHQLLYTCCPFLGELKPVLVEFTIGLSQRSNQLKKITPVSTEPPDSLSSAPRRQLEIQMEEHFFQNHPASMRRCVEFVADRVASNYVKRLRAGNILDLLRRGRDRVTQLTSSCQKGNYDHKAKVKMQNDLFETCVELARDAKSHATQERERYCQQCVASILRQLLPEEISQGVLKSAVAIAARLAVNKVEIWCKANLNAALFNKELTLTLDKQVKTKTFVKAFEDHVESRDEGKTEGEARAEGEDQETVGPSDALSSIKEAMCCLVSGSEPLDSDRLRQLLGATGRCLRVKEEALVTVYRSLTHALIDFNILVACTSPTLLTSELMTSWLTLLSGPLHGHVHTRLVLCTKHVLRLQLANNQNSWSLYCDLVWGLYERGCVDLGSAAGLLLAIIQHPWTQETLDHLAKILCSLVSGRSSRESHPQPPSAPAHAHAHASPEISEALRWLQQLCGKCSQYYDTCERCLSQLKIDDESKIMSIESGENNANDKIDDKSKIKSIETFENNVNDRRDGSQGMGSGKEMMERLESETELTLDSVQETAENDKNDTNHKQIFESQSREKVKPVSNSPKASRRIPLTQIGNNVRHAKSFSKFASESCDVLPPTLKTCSLEAPP